MEEKDLEYVEDENEEIEEEINTNSNIKTKKKINKEELVAKDENFDFIQLLSDLQKMPKKSLDYNNKNYSSKINKVIGSVLYRNEISNKIENVLRSKGLIVDGGNRVDQRAINKICFMIGSPKNKTLKKDINEYIYEETEMSKVLIRYPYTDAYETGEEYHKLHRQNIKTYTNKLYDYVSHDFLNIVKNIKTVNFSKLSESEIFTIFATITSGQDLLDNLRGFEPENFLEKFNTYEKNNEFNRLANLVNVCGTLFSAECYERGIDLKLFGLGFNLKSELDDEERPTFLYHLGKDTYKSLFNYYRKEKEILLPVDRLFNLNANQIDQCSYLVEGLFDWINNEGEVAKNLYSNDCYDSLYIDGVSFSSIIRQQLGPNYDRLSSVQLKQIKTRELLKLIKNGDKLVEFAQINTFKDTYTVKVVPVTFDYSDKTIKKRYQKLLKTSQISPLVRYDKIVSNIKTKVEELQKTNKKLKNFKEELEHSRKFNKVLSEYIFKYNKDNVNKEEFKAILDQVFKDAKKRNKDQKIDKQILKEIDASPMFKNKEAVRHTSTIFSREYDFALSLVKYATHANNVHSVTSVSRDATRYFLSLYKDTTAVRSNKTLRYIKACELRDAEPNKRDYSLMREITNELIKDMLNSPVYTNLKSDEALRSINARMNQAFLIRQTFDADKEYFNKFREEEPYKYYALIEKCAYYERYYDDTRYETTAVSGFVSAHETNDGNGLISYSRGTNTMFYSPSINTSRNQNALNMVFLENAYTKNNLINLNLDMSVYGTFGTKNDLVYDHLNEFSLDDFVNEANRIENNEIGDIDTDTVLDRYGSVGLSVKATNVMLTFYKNSFESQRELVNDFLLGQKNYNDYFLSSITLNNRTLKDLTSEYKENHPNIELKEMDLASAIFAHGLNDPSQTITFTNLVFKDNKISAKTCVVKKNYDYLTSRTKGNHTGFEKFLHAFGMKYNSEKMEKKQRDTLKLVNKTTLDNISQKFEEKFAENFARFNSKFELANAKDKINELNSIDLLNRRNLEVDLEDKKSLNKVNAKGEVKNEAKEKVNDENLIK